MHAFRLHGQHRQLMSPSWSGGDNSRDKEKGGRRTQRQRWDRHRGTDWRDRSGERDVNFKGQTVNHLSFPTLSWQAESFTSLPGVQGHMHQHPPTLVLSPRPRGQCRAEGDSQCRFPMVSPGAARFLGSSPCNPPRVPSPKTPAWLLQPCLLHSPIALKGLPTP